jgi:hypothetical protein
MKPVEIVLRKEERENNRGNNSNKDLFISTYVTITMYPLHDYYMLIKMYKL